MAQNNIQIGARRAGEVVVEPVSSRVTAGQITLDYQLGTIYVPENRAEPKSRVIGVGFARVRALQPPKVPNALATFILPGGPGSSFVSSLPNNPALVRQIAQCRRAGDVVVIDQRGYSERGEILTFTVRTAPEPLDQPANGARSTADFVEKSRAALADFAGRGVDLRGYTVKECADDVNDLRKALGYQRIILWGTSFGSQWSFAVMRRHPDVVARSLLSGVEPLNCGYDMPSHVFAAVQRMWWEAEQEPRLKPYLPPGGLVAAARAVLKRLEQEPVQAQARFADRGEAHTVTLGKEDFQKVLLYLGTSGPAFVLSVYHRRYEALAQMVLRERSIGRRDHQAIGFLIDTSLHVTPQREYLLKTDPALEFLGSGNFEGYMATADIWPSPDVGDDFRTEVTTPIPIVFVQGDWDTQTPLENALNVAPFFTNGRLLIAERGGHGVLDQIADQQPQVYEALMEFVRTGSTEKIPTRISLPLPGFGVPGFPPPSIEAATLPAPPPP